MNSDRNNTTIVDEHRRRLAFGMFVSDPSRYSALNACTIAPLARTVWVEDFLSLYSNVMTKTCAVDGVSINVTQRIVEEQERTTLGCNR